MAITYRTPTSAFTSTSTSHTGNRPTGTASGDLLLAALDIQIGGTVTPPAGWTLRATAVQNSFACRVYTKQAGGSEPTSYTWTVSTAKTGSLHIMAISGLLEAPEATSDSDGTKVGASVTSVTDNGVLVGVFSASSDAAATGGTWGPPGGMTERADKYNVALQTEQLGTAGATGTRTGTHARADSLCSVSLLAFGISNNLPNAPTLTSPTGSVVLDRADATVLQWTHSDPDGDAQADAEVRYQTGGGGWTTVTGKGTATSHSITGGTLAAGDWEWQARTSDAEGFGPWSSSAYFTLADRPTAPVITAPADAATVTTAAYTLTHTHGNSPSNMQVVVTNTAGTTTHYDSGTVAWATSHAATLFPNAANGTSVKVKSRVRKDGLWSTYDTHTVTVDYDPPATPTCTVNVLQASSVDVGLRVSHTNPTPTGGQPTVTSMEVWRRVVGDADAGTRVAVTGAANAWQQVAVGGDFDDYHVADGVDYEYRVMAISDDDEQTASAWTSAVTLTIAIDDDNDPFFAGDGA